MSIPESYEVIYARIFAFLLRLVQSCIYGFNENSRASLDNDNDDNDTKLFTLVTYVPHASLANAYEHIYMLCI